MSTAFLTNELTNLSSEAKRKNIDLRNAADKSLQDLKALPATSEQQLAAEPFLIACKTRNPKFAVSGILCLQKLIIAKGLPKTRLQDALEAFNTCTDLSLDIQLKILQALPSLLQNYATDLEGALLSGALQVCSALQAVKAPTVNGVATATLQQLVATVFEKVTTEDKHADTVATTAEVPGQNGPIALRPAAFDAYRLFRDLALAAEDRRTKFVQFTSFSIEAGLELIWSCMDSSPELFDAHEELLAIIGINVFPVIIRALTEKLTFPVTLRSIRVLNVILERYMDRFLGECEAALGLCIQALELDPANPWKRLLVMELFRDFLNESHDLIRAYASFDSRDGGKPVVQDLMSAFVRLSTEKPTTIGLGQQSSIPVGPANRDAGGDQASIDSAGGMAGVISSALGVTEVNVAGVSTQWSLPKTSVMDLLDKDDPPAFPETYIFALVLECLTGLSDGLARTILPLTVLREKGRPRTSDGVSAANGSADKHRSFSHKRSASFRLRTVPLNPLEAENAPYMADVKSVAGIVDTCWPAVLATSSTFLNAALDDQYFRNLIKSYQRFAQVAGLLRLTTPRDALMTTLAKASVPPHIPNGTTPETARSPATESPRIVSNSKNLISVDSLVSQASAASIERDRRFSIDVGRPMLTVRNLLCLRALLNLAIALGPTLESALGVVVGALRQADMILSTTTPQQMTRQGSNAPQKPADAPSAVQAFSAEVAAVEAAASRLLESTADYPNDAFCNVLDSFSRLLHGDVEDMALSPGSPKPDLQFKPPKRSTGRRTFSGLPGLSALTEVQARDYQFVVPKLGHLAALNISRFISEDPGSSGWTSLTEELVNIARTNSNSREARRMATNVIVKLAAQCIAETGEDEPADRSDVQSRSIVLLSRLVSETYLNNDEITSVDLDVHGHVLDSLRDILERSGDALVLGWDRIIAIISTAFEHKHRARSGPEGDTITIDWHHISYEQVSPQIGRQAFAATQLVCSDFLSALPSKVTASLVELLFRFMRQTADLNIALTTITMAWNVSDAIFNAMSADELVQFVESAEDFDDLEEDLQPLLNTSKPAQWMSLLVKLRQIAVQPTKEVRNAAFQTVCGVFKNHGSDLPPATWDLLLRSTTLQISRADYFLHNQDNEDDDVTPASTSEADIDMSKVIIAGNSEIFAQNLHTIEQIKRLPSLWEVFLSMLERYLDLESHILTATVFSALSRVLSGIDPSSTVWKGPTYRTVHLWLKRVPLASDERDQRQGNQSPYVAYAEAGLEIYRLTRDTMSMSQTRSMIDNLYHCVETSDEPLHGADVNNMSTLQSRVMDLLKGIRRTQPNIPSCLVTVAANLASLHHERNIATEPNKRPTFVVIASEAIDWLKELVSAQIEDHELIDSGALTTATASLRRITESKYSSRLEYKGLPLWRRAIATSLALAKPVLEQAQQSRTETSTRQALWADYVGLAGGIVSARGIELMNDSEKIYQDELLDMKSFEALRDVLIPRMGASELPQSIRLAYAQSLFDASSIHPPELVEIPLEDKSPLTDLQQVRRGRWKPVPVSSREDMSYVCFKQLITLASKRDGSVEYKNLAQAAAPLLILRLAIPIRAYIADQPLRGLRPQPLSQVEELLFCFETIKSLSLEPEALSIDALAAGRTGEWAHIPFLYPLLVKAVSVASNQWCGNEKILGALQEVLAAITPGS